MRLSLFLVSVWCLSALAFAGCAVIVQPGRLRFPLPGSGPGVVSIGNTCGFGLLMRGGCVLMSSDKGSGDGVVLDVDPDLIDVSDPGNGRLEEDYEGLRALSRSISDVGLLSPIVVRPRGERYELVAGNRRLAAWRMVRSGSIPCRVFQLDDGAAAGVRLLENTARAGLSPFEEAVQLGALMRAGGRDVDDLAGLCGRSRAWVEGRLELLDFPADLVEQVHAGRLSLGAARCLARIEPESTRDYYIGQAVLHGINIRTARDWERASRECLDYDPGSTAAGEPLVSQHYQSVVTTECWGCREVVPIERTSSVRICDDCVRRISEVAGG